MNIVEKDVEFINSISHIRTSKVLIQNPGKNGNIIKYIIDSFNKGLYKVIPNSSQQNTYRRSGWIRKHILYIVDEHPINAIWIRGSINDENRVYGYQFTNFKVANPLTFNYWNLPEKSFDIIISENPVRLEMLKDNGIIIKNF